MFRILTSYFVLLLFVGCSDSNESEFAQLLETKPAHGERLQYNDEIRFIFDKPVQRVKVNDINASPIGPPPVTQWQIEAKQLSLVFSDVIEEVLLNVTYQVDGDFHSAMVSFFPVGNSLPLLIANSNVIGQHNDFSPDFLNENGITISFNKPIVSGCIEIKPVVGIRLSKPVVGIRLGWIADWAGSKVTITPRKDQGLVNGTEYVIEIKNVEDTIGQVLNTQITFRTNSN